MDMLSLFVTAYLTNSTFSECEDADCLYRTRVLQWRAEPVSGSDSSSNGPSFVPVAGADSSYIMLSNYWIHARDVLAEEVNDPTSNLWRFLRMNDGITGSSGTTPVVVVVSISSHDINGLWGDEVVSRAGDRSPDKSIGWSVFLRQNSAAYSHRGPDACRCTRPERCSLECEPVGCCAVCLCACFGALLSGRCIGLAT